MQATQMQVTIKHHQSHIAIQ